ncbi:HAD family hydrolase [Palleronia pelagia]|uniref:2-haloacid dehalogenase n=1 Tax=Palleronia pelagia TaxID=387096 RepID=A0A1H8FM20_9RHOB|nr:HAD family phosphatase [Palleronia pelagia]SEN32739.1 2-haloacid dehalogenase [Palleronia pelagia]
MRPEIVVFDIGNVLIGWQPDRFYDGVIGPGARQRLFAEVPLTAMNERVDAGASMQDEVQALARAHPEWRDEILMWHTRWADMVHPVIDHSVALLRALRGKGVPVWALTNFGVETYRIAQGRFDFLNDFDRAIVSGHHRVIKPDPRLYAILEDAAPVPPERLLFADDRADNVAAAIARGWRAHHFTSPAGWAACLVDAGLLSPEEAAAPGTDAT